MLLGLLTASPHRLRELLTAPVQDGVPGGICCRLGPEGWADVVTGLWPRQVGTVWCNDVSADLSTADREEWTDLLTRCEPACALVTLTDLEAFRRWGSQIVRFSFVLDQHSTSARLLGASRAG